MGSGAKKSRSSVSSRRTSRAPAKPRFVLCLSNEGYPASLEARKVYAVLNDAEAARLGFLRVVDESGEDYLFPRGHFADVRLSTAVTAALTATSR